MFEIKDSGKKMKFDSGMVRDTAEGKPDFGLAVDGPMFERWAMHLSRAVWCGKYEARNWMKAAGEAELQRFRSSAFRHFVQWYNGDTDEDHAAAVFFNLNGHEYVKGKLSERISIKDHSPIHAPEQAAAEAPKRAAGHSICNSSGETSAGSVSPNREDRSSGGHVSGDKPCSGGVAGRSEQGDGEDQSRFAVLHFGFKPIYTRAFFPDHKGVN